MTDSEAPGIAPENSAENPVETALEPGPPPPGWLRALSRRPLAVLALLGLVLWLPGVLSLPPLDRDESRFAQSSRQMVESGDWVDLRFGHVPRYKKPAGIYWLQAAATEVAGMGTDNRIWTYRLPSLLGGIAAGWLTFWCALAIVEAGTALLAGLLLMGSVLLTAEATIATTDAVLLTCVLAVQGVLLRLYRAGRDAEALPVPTKAVMWGWAAFAFGVLVKGPVVLGVAAAGIIGVTAWDWWLRRGRESHTPLLGWLRDTRPIRGVMLALLIILPWLVAITIQSRGAFFEQSLGGDFAAKMAGGQESHGGWPGYYLLASALTFWPAILFVAPGIALGFARRNEPGIRFLLMWAASWWIAVEAVPTKLPHYILDAYPPLAILAALFVLDPRPVRFLAAARWIGLVQFLVGAGLLTVAIVLAPLYFGQGLWWPLLAAAGVGAVLALAALILALLRKLPWAVVLALLALLVFAPTLTAGVGPRLDQFWISQRLKALVDAAAQPGDAPPALAGYEEPSLVFALGKDVVLTDGAGAAEATARSGGLALVEDGEQGDFFARLAELQADARPAGDLSGVNYSRGRKVHVTLYRVAQLRGLN